MAAADGSDAVTTDGEALRSFVFDVASIPGPTNVEILGDSPEVQPILELLGRDLVTKVLVQTPQLSVYHETAKPGERVKAHRHGVFQVDYILRGELRFGSQRVTPGMGYFIPDRLYSWQAGDDGGRVDRDPLGHRGNLHRSARLTRCSRGGQRRTIRCQPCLQFPSHMPSTSTMPPLST
jgi:hypothetical protein